MTGPTTASLGRRPAALPADVPVIDVDVHTVAPTIDTLFPWLDTHWQEVARVTQFRGPTDTAYPPGAETSIAPQHREREGVAETLQDIRDHVLEPWGTERAILNCAYSADAVKNPDAALALSRAVNSWVREEWLAHDERLRGSIVVPSLDPHESARVIDEFGDDPRFVQVLLPVRAFAPYGNRIWLPVMDAAARHDLAIGLHFGGTPGHPTTSVGWPSTYVEEYVDMASAFQAQLMSLVAEGVFDRLPTLRVMCLESGFGWMPSFLWRFDRLWRGLRREIPWTRRPPSAYVREHVCLSMQPFDVPSTPQAFERIVDQIGSESMLCFATDYPHWQADSAEQALPPLADGEQFRAIMAGNARSLYGTRLGG